MAKDALDPVALAVELLVVTYRLLPVRFWRNDCLDAPPLQIGSDGVGVVSLVRQQRLGFVLWQIDQFFVGFAVRGFAGRKVEGDRPASGITETMNFTGEPAPRAAKSSS